MQTLNEHQDNSNVNRTFKDSLFRMVFQDKNDLLDLYNAVNDTQYTDPDLLTINTLENAIYLTVKNDISFLIGCTMSLYEHQSSYNPNMPLRGLIYFGVLYDQYVKKWNLRIFSSTLQMLPTPRYIIFYNGQKKEPDRTILRLSDAFNGKKGCLECEATMLNINYGHNKELMEKCQKLKEYAIFVTKVRERIQKDGLALAEAMEKIIDECIRDNILRDILIKEKSGVIRMLLTTFDKEAYEQGLKEEAFEDGKRAGKIEGKIEGEV